MHLKTLAVSTLALMMFVNHQAQASHPDERTTPASFDSNAIERVQTESSKFVVLFNEGKADALGEIYVSRGVLKLPNLRAVGGRENVVETWRNALRVLGNLSLFSLQYEQQGDNRVLETGEYRLEISTPDGIIEQRGTFAVTWRVPRNRRAKPRILFDAIDAN
ncbi:MAG: hypothetical protein AAFN74_23590 [Myxococcota bacterium]